MKFKIETFKLNDILNIVEKGVGNSKIIPITEYLHFQIEEGKLRVTATDSTNYISYVAEGIEGDAGEVVIHAASLIKLASKTTKKEMQFELKDDHIKVKGNGTYKIPILEEDFPAYEFNSTEGTKVEVDTLKKAFAVNEQSISKEMFTPVLTGYNIGDKVITTDGIKMCINRKSILDEPILINQSIAELISVIPDKEVEIQKDGNKLLFQSKSITIFGSQLEGIEDYPDIEPLLDLEHDGTVKLDKKELIASLERLSIFADPFENNGVNLTFKDKKLELKDLKGNSKEQIEYTEKISGDQDVSLSVNIQYLKDLLSVLEDNEVELSFGDDLPLKIEEGDVFEILSTMEEIEEE